MRTKLYIMAEELKKRNIKVTAVKTDCIYASKKPDLSKLSFQVGDTFGSIKDVVEDKFETKSELKMHDLDENCCDNCQAKCVVIDKRSVKVKYVKPQEFNKIELDDEFDNKEFNKLMNKTLIRAEFPRAGKTTNTIMYYQSIGKKVLVVSPTNVLALDIQTKFENVVAITFCNFAGFEEAKSKKLYHL